MMGDNRRWKYGALLCSKLLELCAEALAKCMGDDCCIEPVERAVLACCQML